MRFVSYEHEGEQHAGALLGEEIVPLACVTELGSQTPIELLQRPPLEHSLAVPLESVKLRPVIPRPGKIICVGLNYASHITETGRSDSAYPVLFTKFPRSLIGADDPIVIPPESRQVDYEAELAVIIGRAGRRIHEADALDHVAGYSVANDVTMRDFQYLTHQWLQGKAWDASTPLGPCLVPPDEIDDPAALPIKLTLNGELMQDSDTSHLIFDIPKLIQVCSEFTALDVGDVLLTGTPGGVGYRRDPQVFLSPGDRVEVDITGVGRLTNHVVRETSESEVKT
jgi:acylpyruvate hydrolase